MPTSNPYARPGLPGTGTGPNGTYTFEDQDFERREALGMNAPGWVPPEVTFQARRTGAEAAAHTQALQNQVQNFQNERLSLVSTLRPELANPGVRTYGGARSLTPPNGPGIGVPTGQASGNGGTAPATGGLTPRDAVVNPPMMHSGIARNPATGAIDFGGAPVGLAPSGDVTGFGSVVGPNAATTALAPSYSRGAPVSGSTPGGTSGVMTQQPQAIGGEALIVNGVVQPGANPTGRAMPAPAPTGGNPLARGGAGTVQTPAGGWQALPAIGNPGATTLPYPGAPGTQPQTWEQLISSIFPGGQGEFENRQLARSGLDPRMDAMYQFALNQALQRFSDPNGQQFYGGPTVAGLAPDEIAAQNFLRSMTGDIAGMGGAGMDYFNRTLSNAANPQNDAVLNDAITQTLRDVARQTTDPGGVFDQINSSSLTNGSYGGSRQGVMQGVAAGRLADALGRTSAEMRLAGRGQNLQAAQGAINSMPTILGGATAPGEILSGIGAQNRGMEQAFMDDQLQRWAYNTFEPDRRLQNLFSLLGSSNLGGWNAGTSTLGEGLAPGANGGTSNFQNIVGGVAGGVSIYQILRDMGIFG